MQNVSLEAFKKRLTGHLCLEIDLVVHENRWTMLSVLDKGRSSARLSLHKMFLNAPEPVIAAIAQYVRGTKPNSPLLRQYIQEHLHVSDYSHLLKGKNWEHAGSVYHLKNIYDKLNERYFANELNLAITWYGNSPQRKKRRRRITFGLYLSGLRLIKIHRMLDHSFFPEYFVEFVVYHEMLHSVVSGSLDRRGRYCFHSQAFKEREKHFEQYQKAIEWEKANLKTLFGYGWT